METKMQSKPNPEIARPAGTTPSWLSTAALLIAVLGCACCLAAEPAKTAISPNKRTVEKYMEGFTRSDHEAILSCLSDDVRWVIPGAFDIQGKTAFDKEIENDAFTGSPVIKVSRMIEENDVVVAEGTVRAMRKEGSALSLVFCDVFEMQDGKIKRLTSYLMELKQ